MAVDLVMGCQYGSEYKFAGVMQACVEHDYDMFVSVNTCNAGHTQFYKGKKLVARYLPSACTQNLQTPIFIGSGANIHYETFMKEIREFEEAGVPIWARLFISSSAGSLTAEHIKAECEQGLSLRLGSTAHGVGEAQISKIRRENILFKNLFGSEFTFVDDLEMVSVQDVLLEASQGYLLGLNGPFYPKCTSRICDTSAYLSYAKVNPRNLRDVYGVFRTFPIRVANRRQAELDNGEIVGQTYKTDGAMNTWDDTNTSGSMDGLEVDWDYIRKYCGANEDQIPTEITTVTKLPRRIAKFSPERCAQAIIENGVNKPILTFLNYIDYQDLNAKNIADISDKSKVWISQTEHEVTEVLADRYVGQDNFLFYAISPNPNSVFLRF